MEMRTYGRTGMKLSVLGFGCGAVGGLMVRGDPRDQERAIARALEVGVNYFDTAVQYGNGESEKNLGRVLQTLKPANVVVGTKVRLPGAEFGRIGEAVATSLEGSLTRLRRDRVDIFHLHNAIVEKGGGEALGVRQVLDEVVPAFERLRQAGKIRFLGLTAVGDTAALHQVIGSHRFDSAQVVYNMLNPSAAAALPANYPAQDYGRLFDHTAAAGTGVIAIRVLAGGALSGSADRHPIASPPPAPIGLAMSYEARHGARPSPDAVGHGGICREPDRSRDAVCDCKRGDWHHPGGNGYPATVRGCLRRGRKRPAAACRPGAALGAAPRLRGRDEVITRAWRARAEPRPSISRARFRQP